MPQELIAVAPRTPVLRAYEDPPLGPTQIRIKTEFASPNTGRSSSHTEMTQSQAAHTTIRSAR